MCHSCRFFGIMFPETVDWTPGTEGIRWWAADGPHRDAATMPNHFPFSVQLGRLGLALGLVLGVATTPVLAVADVINWRMNSLLYPQLFGEAGQHFAETVQRITNGGLVIKVHDRLVLDQDTFGALESGLIDAAWGSAGHHHREDAALTIFTGFPFGPDPAGFTAWMQTGGGSEALGAIYARHGLKSLYCGILPAEGGGWFVTPVDSPGDLEGCACAVLAMVPGFSASWASFPTNCQQVKSVPHLNSGLIAAAEFSLPSIDAELGLAEVAKHLYFPGWQQPVTSLEFLLPERSWAALSDRHKRQSTPPAAKPCLERLPKATARQIKSLESSAPKASNCILAGRNPHSTAAGLGRGYRG